MNQTATVFDKNKNFSPLFTKTQVGKYIFHQSPATFNTWIKTGKIFPPTIKKDEWSERTNYDLLDVLKISIIIHGYVHMENLTMLLADERNYEFEYFQQKLLPSKEVKTQLRNALSQLRQDIKSKSTDPVDLHPYLLDENG